MKKNPETLLDNLKHWIDSKKYIDCFVFISFYISLSVAHCPRDLFLYFPVLINFFNLLIYVNMHVSCRVQLCLCFEEPAFCFI